MTLDSRWSKTMLTTHHHAWPGTVCEGNCDGGNPPPRYTKGCEANRKHLMRRLWREGHSPSVREKKAKLAAEVAPSTSWELYSSLMDQQQLVIKANADIDAFNYGIDRFPALVRITITPATHGYLFTPLYETPFIRSLPSRLNYLIPRGWPTALDFRILSTPSWGDSLERDFYRGFNAVIGALAEKKCTKILELVTLTCQQPTGISCEIFSEPNREYGQFCQVLKQPGFRRLDLSLHANLSWRSDWVAFRNGRLYSALENATDLERFYFYTNVDSNPDAASVGDSDGSMKHFIPLQTIFPICKWPKLKYFGLARFLVCQSDVIKLLAALPECIEEIELSFLYFLEGGGNYGSLLDLMKDELKWDQRPVSKQPRVSLLVDIESETQSWEIAASLEQEVHDFLYNHGSNPFGPPSRSYRGELRSGQAGIETDVLDPQYRRKFAHVNYEAHGL